MKNPVPIRRSVACHIDAWDGRYQKPSAHRPARSMQKKHVLTPRPLNTLSVNQPAKTVPTTAAPTTMAAPKKTDYNRLTGLDNLSKAAKGKRPVAIMINNIRKYIDTIA